jgi:hypothetical protein
MKNGEQQKYENIDKKWKKSENNKRVLKMHVGIIKGIRLDMIFFFLSIKGH